MASCCGSFSGATPTVGDPCVCNSSLGATFTGTDGSVWVRTVVSVPCAVSDFTAVTGFTCASLNTCSITQLSDVDTTTVTPVSQYILEWSGTNWVPAPLCGRLIFCSINALQDVDTASIVPFVNSVLTWNGTRWYPGPSNAFSCASINVCTIDALIDVNTTSNPPAVGNVLAWDGTNWVPSSAAGFTCASLNSCSINSLQDVDTVSAAPVAGDALIWNGTTWVPDTASVTVTYNQDVTSTNSLRVTFTAATNTLNIPPPVTAFMSGVGLVSMNATPGVATLYPVNALLTTVGNDTVGGFADAATGIFTVPKTGIYNLSGSVAAAQAQYGTICPDTNLYMSFRINGVNVGRYSVRASATGNTYTTQVSGLLNSFNLTAGDTITLAAGHDCALNTGATSAYLGITLIG
jgi:hypothetical protein